MAASFERDPQQTLTDAERRLSNLALIGQIAEVNPRKARVRVRAGAITTGWLPFATLRAGPDRTWHAPEVGEQVLVVSPGGDLNQGVVVGSLYRDQFPPPFDVTQENRERGPNDPLLYRLDISRQTWSDNAVQEYDRRPNRHTWSLSLPADGKLLLLLAKSAGDRSDDATYWSNRAAQELAAALAGNTEQQEGEDQSNGEEDPEAREAAADAAAESAWRQEERDAPSRRYIEMKRDSAKLVIERSSIKLTPDAITLKIGRSSITLDKDGIVIKAKRIDLN